MFFKYLKLLLAVFLVQHLFHCVQCVLLLLSSSGYLHSNWTFLIQTEWFEFFMDLPGSVYIITFIYWLRQSVLLCLLLPFLLIFSVYFTVLWIHLFHLRYWLGRQLNRLWARADSSGSHVNLESLTELLKRLVAAFWDAHGRIFHGYEVVGMDKLPVNGPVYIIYYHGTCPFDAYYFLSRYCIERDRFPVPVVDRFLFRVPGLSRILELVGAIEGSVDECVLHLSTHPRHSRGSLITNESSEGDVLLLAPGGIREALFSDEFYEVIWEKRQGFARVSILSQQPIYPMFTENVREPIRVMQFGKSWWRKLYEYTRLPIAIFYGYFPVKLRTYIGDPIYPRPNETAEELAIRVRIVMQGMIKRHQFIPANLCCALLQRIPAFDRWLQKRKYS